MSRVTKPMLAGTIKSLDQISYPIIASPKLDGIRCLKLDGEIVSRTFKPIPNHYIRETLKKLLPEGADGEIMVGSNFQEVSSGVMSREGEPDFSYWMFDLVTKDTATCYRDRLQEIFDWFKGNKDDRIVRVPAIALETEEALLNYEAVCLGQGYEGVMVRSPEGPYKCGRSTVREGWLLKLKRFEDREAEVLGFIEQQKNINEATKDELGRTKRSSAKAGKVGKGTLGKFEVRDLTSGVEFMVGTGEGLTDELRLEIWNNRKRYRGQIIKYKCQPHGEKDKPRLPIFLGFRSSEDM